MSSPGTPRTLVFVNPKGGVGKSLGAILAIEYFTWKGRTLTVRDADDNHTTGDFLEECAAKGRAIPQSAAAEVAIVDTAGLPGAVAPFLDSAHLVAVPFKGLRPDVARLIQWYDELPDAHRRKMVLFPNMVRSPNPTQDHVIAFATVRQMLEEDGRAGAFLPGLSLREAVFGRLYNGSDTNFFEQRDGGPSLVNARREASELLTEIEARLFAGGSRSR
ncbi:MAG: hypothetical protein MI919_29620 [Holophagales bacterium]|nr:hypothetical protein [Holophagales bacterium]